LSQERYFRGEIKERSQTPVRGKGEHSLPTKNHKTRREKKTYFFSLPSFPPSAKLWKKPHQFYGEEIFFFGRVDKERETSPFQDVCVAEWGEEREVVFLSLSVEKV